MIGANAVGRGPNSAQIGYNDVTNVQRGNGNSSTWNTGSDSRIKEDIEPVDYDLCLKAVKDIPALRFKYRDFVEGVVDKHVIGWLADDIEKVFPKVVTKSIRSFPVLGEDGKKVYETVEHEIVKKDENGEEVISTKTESVLKTFEIADFKSLDTTIMVPTLWGAVQALIKRIEALETVKVQKRKPKTMTQ